MSIEWGLNVPGSSSPFGQIGLLSDQRRAFRQRPPPCADADRPRSPPERRLLAPVAAIMVGLEAPQHSGMALPHPPAVGIARLAHPVTRPPAVPREAFPPPPPPQ